MFGLRVLYVDDELDVLEQAKIFLEKENESLKVDTAVSAKKGLKLLEEKDYDCVISDYQMPEMDGLEFLRVVREEWESDIPFIIFTGKGREEVAMEALNLGADRYLRKGGDPRSQYGVLAQAIDQEVEYWNAKQKLKSSEKKYRDLTEKSLVGVYIIQDDKFKYVNPEFSRIYGYDRDEIIGKHYLELASNKDSERVKEGVEARQEGEGEPHRYKFEALTKNGKKTVEVFSVPTSYKGEPAVQGTLIDITNRLEVEKELEEIRYAMDASKDPMLIIEKNGKIRFCNEATSEVFGYPKEELIDKNIVELMTEESRENQWKDLKKTIGEEHELDSPRIVDGLKKDGSIFPLECSLSMYERDDDEVRFIAVMRDISGRKSSERKLKLFKTAVESSNDSIYMIDTDYRYVFANDEHLSRLVKDRKISEKSEDEVIGKSCCEIHPDEDSKALEENIDKVIETGESHSVEHDFSGSDRWSHRTYSPVVNEETGEVENVVVISKDITDRKRVEEREEFLDSLLRHDVQNKGQIIEGYLELMEDYDLPHEVNDYLSKAEGATKDAIDIIEKVRTLRDVKQESEVRKVELCPILKDVIEEKREVFEENDIELKCQPGEIFIRGGPLLEELFSNLLENAVIHANCGVVKVSAELLDDKAIVTVEDDGKGISDDVKERLFERGFKEGDTGGTGLGLYLVKQIIEGYGGRIEAKDSELGGARFDIQFQRA